MKLSRTPLALLAFVVPLGAVAMSLRDAGPAEAGHSMAQRGAAASNGTTTARVVAAANTLLETLSDAQRTQATFAFDSPQRTGWSNLPTGAFRRNGLRLGDLTPPQRKAALELVAAALSTEGYQKVTDIMNADEALKNARGGRTGGRQGGGANFGADEYYLALLGTPSATAPWLIQFGGHHLAINVTVVGGSSVLTPSLPATQPARYMLDGRTVRPLGDENDKAFALMATLDAAQRKQAILAYQVRDLVLGPGADGKVIQPEGIPGTALNANQQTMLLDVAREWVGILNDEAATAKMAELKANLSKTYFAWSGATENGGLAYYRIQGPTVVIEYAPQQGDLDHIHTIYRDPTNDYGAKLTTR
jgi:Protein of unknown function (DUF3500)